MFGDEVTCNYAILLKMVLLGDLEVQGENSTENTNTCLISPASVSCIWMFEEMRYRIAYKYV